MNYKNASELYDLIYEIRTKDINFYCDFVAASLPKTILEIGVGTGRILVPIALNNPDAECFGIDEVNDEIVILSEKIKDQEIPNIKIINGYFPQSIVDKKFDLIIAPFRVLQHCLDSDTFIRFCKNVYQSLNDNGHFVFDVFNPCDDFLKKEGLIVQQEFNDRVGNIITRSVFVHSRDFEKQIQFIEEEYSINSDQKENLSLSWHYNTRWHFDEEVRSFLSQSGLLVEKAFGDFDKTAIGVKSPGELIYICKKLKI